MPRLVVIMNRHLSGNGNLPAGKNDWKNIINKGDDTVGR